MPRQPPYRVADNRVTTGRPVFHNFRPMPYGAWDQS